MKLHRLIFVVGFLVSVGAVESFGQTERAATGTVSAHTVRGRVYLPSGAPAEGPFRVTLRTTSLTPISDVVTDSVGNFEFRLVPNGSYEVVVWESERFEMMVERVEVVGRGSRTFVQNVFLRPKEKVVSMRPNAGAVAIGEFTREIPKEAKREYERGVKEAGRKNYEKAVAHFQQALVSYPRYVQAINDLGVQYLRLNRLGDALAAFEQAIEIEPRAPHPHLNLGYIRLQQKEYAQAVEPLAKAVEMDSANWSAHMLYGIALTQLEQFDQAQRELERALSLGPSPEASVVRLQLANLFMRKRDFSKAIEQMENYLSEVPKAQDADRVRDMIKKLKSAR